VPLVAALIVVPSPFRSPVTVVDKVIAGVVVALATVPDNPLADTTETLVTVPAPAGADKIPEEKDNPLPIVTLENPPDPFPYRIDDPDVAGPQEMELPSVVR
jgi:hypothetical protein